MLPPQTGSVRVNLPPHPRGGKQYGGSMNIVSQSSAVLLLGVVTLAGCADRPTGPELAAALTQGFVVDAGGTECDVDGPTWKGDADAAVLNDVAPSGSVRVGI